jgi:hypothetical protein
MRRWYAAGDARLWGVTGAVAALAATALGLLARRGSWYADDLDFLVVGARGFGMEALLTPVNDHVAPGLRAMYALFVWAAPLNYDFTVVVRGVLWAAAVMLMAALLQRLHGRDALTLVGTVFYALSPLSMPSFMSLSSAVNNLPAHVLGLVFLHCTLDWSQRRTTLSLVGAAGALFASMLFWEKSGLIVLTGAALLLSRPRPAGNRGVRASWGWLLACLVAACAFAAIYLTRGGPAEASSPPSPARLLLLWGESLWSSVVATVVGGPVAWAPSSPPYFGLSNPAWWVSVAGAAVTAWLVALCVLRARRALWWWAAVAGYSAATVAVVGYGRFAFFGSLVTRQLHYWSDAVVPLTLAVAGSLVLLRPVRRRVLGGVVASGLALVWLAAVTASNHGFAQLWSANPSKAYAGNLIRSIEDRGRVNLWDTQLPDAILPLSANQGVAGVARLVSDDVLVQDPSSEPLVVRGDGTIVASRFAVWGRSVDASDCRYLLTGADSVRVPLTQPVPSGFWYVKIGYLANPSATVTATAVGDSGAVPLVNGPATWPAGLGTVSLRASRVADVRYITLSTSEPGTNVCVGDITVGVPEPMP